MTSKEMSRNPQRDRRGRNRLDEQQVARAVRALLAYKSGEGEGGAGKKRKQVDLDLGPEVLTVQLGLKKSLQVDKAGPRVVEVPHVVRDVARASACLFVKDADKAWIKAATVDGKAVGPKRARTKLDGTRAAKMARRSEACRDVAGVSKRDDEDAPGDSDESPKESSKKKEDDDEEAGVISKVISLSSLRTSYARFSSRRELRDSYDVFLADDRILPMLAKVLGSTFFSRKKQPIAVDVTKARSLKTRLCSALAKPTIVLRAGNCLAANLAHTDMPLDHVVENVVAGVGRLVEDLVPRQWSGLLNVHLKLPGSVALPVWTADENVCDDALVAEKNTGDDTAKKSPQASNIGPAPPKHRRGNKTKALLTTAAENQDAEAAPLQKEKKQQQHKKRPPRARNNQGDSTTNDGDDTAPFATKKKAEKMAQGLAAKGPSAEKGKSKKSKQKSPKGKTQGEVAAPSQKALTKTKAKK